MSSPIPIPGAPATPTMSSGPNPFAFVQINVSDLARSEGFFRAIFGWHFIGGVTSPPWQNVSSNPLDYDFDYFTSSKHDLSIIGGLLKCSDTPDGEPPMDIWRERLDEREQIDGYHHPGGHRKKKIEDIKDTEIIGAIGSLDDIEVAETVKVDEKIRKGEGTVPRTPESTSESTLESASESESEMVARPPVIAYVSVECIDDTLLRIQSAGGKVLQRRTPLEQRIADLALFSDPDGNVLGLVHDNRLTR